MGNIDLDYDDDLFADAQQFGLEAQGVADVAEAKKEVEKVAPWAEIVNVNIPKELHDALVIAREVYGETNSEHSEVFCDWVGDVLASRTSVKETKEMLALLHRDKENFGGRLAWRAKKGRDATMCVRARRHASICAMNVTRAVLNMLRGMAYEQWIERSLWRAVQTEDDLKGAVYGESKRSHQRL